VRRRARLRRGAALLAPQVSRPKVGAHRRSLPATNPGTNAIRGVVLLLLAMLGWLLGHAELESHVHPRGCLLACRRFGSMYRRFRKWPLTPPMPSLPAALDSGWHQRSPCAASLTKELQALTPQCVCGRSLDPLFMPQIISSAIMNAPPPRAVVRTLHRTNWASECAARCARCACPADVLTVHTMPAVHALLCHVLMIQDLPIYSMPQVAAVLSSGSGTLKYCARTPAPCWRCSTVRWLVR
jgi:hypothetical protein